MKVTTIAEQLTLDGGVEYVVYYRNGQTFVFKDYPTDDDLRFPREQGRQLQVSTKT